MEKTRTGTDCGIIAVCNLLNLDYDTVWKAARECGYLMREDGTTNSYKLPDILKHFGFSCEIVDKEPIIGFYRYRKAANLHGHIMPVICGIRYEYDGSIASKKGQPIKNKTYWRVWKEVV